MAVLGRYAYLSGAGGDTVSDRVVEYTFSTMIGMCLDKVGQSRLGTVGVCKVAGEFCYFGFMFIGGLYT